MRGVAPQDGTSPTGSLERVERVILVSERDEPRGSAEKLHAHRTGLLHRAFSIFVFRSDGSLLLQRRALHKYHTPGLWSNTCCGHPRPDESTPDAALRRLHEEMGFACRLDPVGSFRYRAALDRGLVEHEVDHVFVGRSAACPAPSPAEVAEVRWVYPDRFAAELERSPSRFTPWVGKAWKFLLGAGPR